VHYSELINGLTIDGSICVDARARARVQIGRSREQLAELSATVERQAEIVHMLEVETELAKAEVNHSLGVHAAAIQQRYHRGHSATSAHALLVR
jgi:hypothetical protein